MTRHSDSPPELISALNRDLAVDAIAPHPERWAHLPLCALDAVYSARARYHDTVLPMLRRYIAFSAIAVPTCARDQLLDKDKERTVSSLVIQIEESGAEVFATDVLQNRSRLARRLKAEVVLDLCRSLVGSGIERLSDMRAAEDRDATGLEHLIRRVHGIGPALSRYFLMLAGNDRRSKPDTMILGYLERALGRRPTPVEAEALIVAAADVLRHDVPTITPRALDNAIWTFESTRRANSRGLRRSLAP